MDPIPSHIYKYIRLVINLFVWIALGSMTEILGPTLPDLSIRVNADYEVIGRTLGFRNIGCIFTPFLFGMLFDRFSRSRDFVFGVIVFIPAALSVAIPFCREVWTLTVVLLIQGFCVGGWTTAGQSMIIELFGTSAMSALQFMHIGWGVGSFLANIVVRPFLASDLKLSRKKIKYLCFVNNTTPNITNTTTDFDSSGSESQIEYAYIIIGCYGMFVATIAFFFSFVKKPSTLCNRVNQRTSKTTTLKEMIGPSSISDGKPLFGCFMLISLWLIYTLEIGVAGTFGSYLVTIAIDPCKDFQMTQSNATLLQGVKAVAQLAGRIIIGVIMAILISRKIQPGIMICVGISLAFMAWIPMSLVGLKYEIVFWVMTSLFTFSVAPIYGGCTPWFNQYIRVTSTVIAVAASGSVFGKFALTWIGGYILKTQGSYGFVYLLTALMALLASIIIIVMIVSTLVGKRKTHQEEKKDDVPTGNGKIDVELENIADDPGHSLLPSQQHKV